MKTPKQIGKQTAQQIGKRMAKDLVDSSMASFDALFEANGQRVGRAVPKQKPGRSIQTYSTPPEFIDAVKRKFNIKEFAYDLAASSENTKALDFFCEEEDSLKQDWSKLKGDLWLNCPYSRIAPWAEKCSSTTTQWKLDESKSRIFFLVPAPVGSNWFAQHVDGKALVLLLNGRISFDGVAPYPKNCVLAIYNEKPDYLVWRWQ